MKSGEAEGRQIFLSNWSGQTEDLMTRDDLERYRLWIDPAFLRKASPKVAAFDDDTVISWFLMDGWREGVDPSERFSTMFYLTNNPDVKDVNINPLIHFVRFGESEGRFATQNEAQVAADAAEEERQKQEAALQAEREQREREAQAEQEQRELEEKAQRERDAQAELKRLERDQEKARQEALLRTDMIAVKDDFDADWYRKSYPEISGTDDELLADYMTTGWKGLKDPSPSFSTAYYLDAYQDISESGLNPFLHYALFGRKEGRRCSPDGAVRLSVSPKANLTPGLPDLGPSNFTGKKARPPRKIDPDALDIHWVVPDFRPGSGGHMTIFRMVRYLELFGHKCTVWIEEPTFHEKERDAWETIVKSFQCVEADVRFVSDDLYTQSGDVIIATGWSTAWTVRDLTGFKTSMYFVQDHEPEFYPTGSMSNLAELTYGFELGCICASPWLEKLMSERYGRWAKGFYLAYEPDQYFVSDERTEISDGKGPVKVAVYGRAHTDRRCVQLALAGLSILADSRDDFEVHLFGQDELPFNAAPFAAFNHGVLDPAQLNRLYNDCDIGICFSGTNYSLVPQEMMACGLPLIEFNTESTQVIFPKNTVTLAGPAPTDIAAKVAKLIDDPAKRLRQRKAALKWVKSFSWEASAREVEAAIQDYLTQKGAKLASPSVNASKEILFDVVIPTWNGKEEFEPVLEALRSQRIADQIQIHCVDSTSTDGTIDWLKGQKDVSLTVIDQKDFQHGRTRNYGASLGTAPFVGFITQDAMPATVDWATDIVKMMRAVPDAAGLFGRHIAYPDHPIFVREEITKHFENMKQYPLVLSKFTDPERWDKGDIGWRQFLHFYSDNNSAMRRSVWNEIPYPEVDYGEDQVWARTIIEAGYSKIYAPTATVYHSHDYDPEQTYKRSKTEGAFFLEHFGYELGKGSESDINDRIAREQRDMEAWGRRRAVSSDEIEMRKANIVEKYRGWRDGRAEVGNVSSADW
ncbi:glycosyltransferase [Sulfitobacter noctilucicola]|uniref:Glycosyltransferase involved in cell wall biosynthesis/GT2 family glycosyltransferase n=1 Tax=Sulfitobacter noctilucicola TaxID=1342301 RepID=A0A7W6MBZ5_9RHOB|nr:glycosyltransferase [Sulfitobacter noctilucicola]MBB4175281.1 glycosyltransferase involved in cell wall biosynthesis/GT2 family glycosyltransferase [Sulfitobacter noctilucicola]